MSQCRHRMRSTGYVVVQLPRTGRSNDLPRFAVFTSGACSDCGVSGHKLLRTLRAVDGWEAARLAGVPEADLSAVNIRGAPASPAPASREPIAVPLTSWPFPVSTHYPKEPTP